MLAAIGEMEIRFRRSGQQQLLVETLLVRFALLDRTVALEEVLRAMDAGGSAPPPPRGGVHVPDAPARREPPRSESREPRAESREPAGETREPRAEAAAVRAIAIEPPASRKPTADLNALTGRWDQLVGRARDAGKALLASALESSSADAISKDGTLTIRLDEPNDFHARAIEQDSAIVLSTLREWFSGVEKIVVHRDKAAATPEKPVRITDEAVKSQRLASIRKKDPTLDAVIDVLDLEIAD
jgi:DNA polymerase-3 subunit gamma/tau